MKKKKSAQPVPLPRTRISQRGYVAVIGIVSMVLLVLGLIAFGAWALSARQKPVLVYTPPAVSADDELTAGRSTKEIFQDVKILDAAVKRGETLKSAADKAVNDEPLPTDVSSTSVAEQEDDVSGKQTTLIKEVSRRTGTLSTSKPLLEKLTEDQRPTIEQLLEAEQTTLTGIRSAVNEATDASALATQQQALDQEYNAFLLVLSQINVLVWANDQLVLEDKFTKVGGKFQERAEDASNNGKSVVMMQSLLNGYQANRVTAGGQTAEVLKVLPPVKPGEQNSNRSVLKTHLTQLNSAHNELKKALNTAKKLALEVQKFDTPGN